MGLASRFGRKIVPALRHPGEVAEAGRQGAGVSAGGGGGVAGCGVVAGGEARGSRGGLYGDGGLGPCVTRGH